MRELDRIAGQLHHAVHGGAWHGPSLLELLAGVDARAAAAHPIAGAHGMWEILLHVTVWTRVVMRRMSGETVQPAPEQDWPPVPEATQAAWLATVEDFCAAQKDLAATIKSMRDEDLDQPVSGEPYDAAFQLHGLVQHHLYHAGQIALLKKAARSSP